MKLGCLALVSIIATVHAKGAGLLLNILIGTLVTDVADGSHDEITTRDVVFYLYTREHPDRAVEIDENTIQQINKRNPVKFIVHGWLESANRPWYKDMTRAFLRKGDYNVIQVDWSKPASKRYDVSASNTRQVGAMIGRLIVNLYINYGVPLNNFQVIGHSLGGHVSGFAGKEVFKLTNSKLPRITALDPAGPLFETPPFFNLEGLNQSDAAVIDVIHTDAGVFGYKGTIGTVDFYPNGGTSLQPGCSLLPENPSLQNIQEYLDNLFCSHTRSYIYYIRSINDERFISTKCSSWNRFKSKQCDNNVKAVMGDDYAFAPEATGSFYLRTNRSRRS